MEKKTIVIEGSSGNYHASLKEDPRVWAMRRTFDEAIGEMIQKAPETFGVVIEYPPKNT